MTVVGPTPKSSQPPPCAGVDVQLAVQSGDGALHSQHVTDENGSENSELLTPSELGKES